MRISLTTSAGRSRVWKILGPTGRIVVGLVVAFLTAVGLLLWQAKQGQEDLIESAALQQAELYAQTLADVRTLYTSEVVARVGTHGIEVTHDYADKDGAIPLPATLSMMLGERITEGSAGGSVRLYSDFPFPWNTDGGPKDDFQVEALTRLRQDPSNPVFRFDSIDSRPIMRYATADLMRESCVGCHNSHPASPKTNWKVGDLRGVLEVAVPLDAARKQAIESFRGTFFLLLLTGALAISPLIIMVPKLRKKWGTSEPGQRFGQYTLQEKVGVGGMGMVFKARHALLKRPTAVKILRGHEASQDSIARFELEVQHTSRLNHPNTIAIYDYGHTPDGDFYYAMEFLEGLSLEQLVKRFGPVNEARTVHILMQACASLHEAHEANLVHRDVNPGNIMLCQHGGESDVVKVLDFGLVKRVGGKDADPSLTGTHARPGTPLYMSPEQIVAPDTVGPASDIYQIGGVGYYLLTGGPVFLGKSEKLVLEQHVWTQPRYPSAQANKKFDRDLENVLMECLQKDSAARPDGMDALMNMLENVAAAGKWDRRQARDWWVEHESAVLELRSSGR